MYCKGRASRFIRNGGTHVLTDEEKLACLPEVDERRDEGVVATHMLDRHLLLHLTHSIQTTHLQHSMTQQKVRKRREN